MPFSSGSFSPVPFRAFPSRGDGLLGPPPRSLTSYPPLSRPLMPSYAPDAARWPTVSADFSAEHLASSALVSQSSANDDESRVKLVYHKLRSAHEASYSRILQHLASSSEEECLRLCIDVLKRFKTTNDKRSKTFPVAKAMFDLFPTRKDAFVNGILNRNLLGRNRLNVAVRLEYFSLSPMIILSNLVINQGTVIQNMLKIGY